MTMSPTDVRARTSTVSAGAFRGLGAVERVVHLAHAGADVEPGRRALADAHLEVADLGLDDHRAPHGLAQADVAAGRLGDDVGVRRLDVDVAVGSFQPHIAVGNADPRVAVGVLDHRAAFQLAQAHVARSRGDLRAPRHMLDADVAEAAPQVQRLGLLDPDAPEAGLDLAVAEAAFAAEVRKAGRTVNPRAGRQLDRHFDGRTLPVHPGAELRHADQQLLVRVLDARELRGLDVVGRGRVARTDLDDGGVTVAGADVDVAHDELDRGGDWFGGGVGRHLGALLVGEVRGHRTQPV